MGLMARIRGLYRREELGSEIEEELQSHVEMRAEDNLRAGIRCGEARAQAQRQFGSSTRLKEETRGMDLVAWIESAGQDLRYAARMLRRSPGFTALAVLTLALGIGANTAIFSAVKGVLLNPLPYRRPSQLVKLAAGARSELSPKTVSFLLVQDWRERSRSFQSLAVYGNWTPTMTGQGRPEILSGARVTHEFFDTLGIPVALGRGFAPEEDRPDRRQVVLLSYGFWKTKFGGDPGVVGKTITLSRLPYQIIGVLPQNFEPLIFNFNPIPTQLWSLLGYRSTDAAACRTCRGLQAVARLADGVSLKAAQAEINGVTLGLTRDYPDSYPAGFKTVLTPLDAAVAGDSRRILWILFGATGFVLLIACANTTSLLLSRAAARRREMALRLALGGSRGRIIRQLLTETTLLTLLSGAAGVVVAMAALRGFMRLAPQDIPRLADIRLDPTVLLWTLAISVVVGQAVGLVPGISGASADQREILQQGTRNTPARMHRRMRNGLIAGEVAMAFVLASGTGLLLRSLQSVLDVHPGFRSEHVFTTNTALLGPAYVPPGALAQFEREMLPRIDSIPGVEHAATVSTLPLSGAHDRRALHVQDHILPNLASAPFVDSYFVSPDYFRAMEIPLVRGRYFSEADTAPNAVPVAIVSELTAQQMWPEEDALGKRIQLGLRNDSAPWATIVGIVGDIHQYGLDSAATAEAYQTTAQAPLAFPTIVVRSRLSPAVLERGIEEQIASVDKNAPVFLPATMDEVVALSVAPRRFLATLVACFGAVALLLATIGVYGVISYQVTQRANEIGVRMAVGASPSRILRLVTAQGMLFVATGIVAGAAIALVMGKLLASQLYGVGPYDAPTLAGAAVILLLAALVACYLPARRATRVDPVVALRYE